MGPDLSRRLLAEGVGTAFLVAIVVGSGIMAERMAGGNDAIALLGNTLATGAGLIVLVLVFGPVSGAHLNPAVTLSFLIERGITGWSAACYALAQMAGAVCGVMLANLMFAMPALGLSAKARDGMGVMLGEAVATAGLILTIHGCRRARLEVTACAVGLFVAAGYWFTSSTGFANPAVTAARMLSDTFTGIRPADAMPFVVVQVLAAVGATMLGRYLFRPVARPHP